jgi:hypothetical protein
VDRSSLMFGIQLDRRYVNAIHIVAGLGSGESADVMDVAHLLLPPFVRYSRNSVVSVTDTTSRDSALSSCST